MPNAKLTAYVLLSEIRLITIRVLIKVLYFLYDITNKTNCQQLF